MNAKLWNAPMHSVSPDAYLDAFQGVVRASDLVHAAPLLKTTTKTTYWFPQWKMSRQGDIAARGLTGEFTLPSHLQVKTSRTAAKSALKQSIEDAEEGYEQFIKLSTDSRANISHPQHSIWRNELVITTQKITDAELAIARHTNVLDNLALVGVSASVSTKEVKEAVLNSNEKINFQPTSTTSGISSIHAYDLKSDIASAIPVSVDTVIANPVPASQIDISLSLIHI